jgi:hypothetical protein
MDARKFPFHTARLHGFGKPHRAIKADNRSFARTMPEIRAIAGVMIGGFPVRVPAGIIRFFVLEERRSGKFCW